MRDKTRRRLFVIDQMFKDFHGHHYEYNVSIADVALDLGLDAVIVASHDCDVDMPLQRVSLVPWFRYTWYDAESRAGSAHVTFLDELMAYLEQVLPTAQDMVLIHTVAMSEFIQFLDNLAGTMWHEAVAFPTFYLVLRRDPDEYYPSQMAHARALLKKAFHCPSFSDKLILCSDTEELSRAWSGALQCPFLTIPIPFRHALLENKRPAQVAHAPKSVIYLGDARNEKGYQHLPHMVFGIWERYIATGRAECVFQSNYNLPGGEGGIREARLRLQQFPYGVRLLTDLLSTEAYYRILSDGDIVVLPYDRERYERRSSGVLNEAVVAGKVVVVPKGTWLAKQVAPAGSVVYEYPSGLSYAVAYAIENFEALSAAAVAHASQHAAKHSPKLLVRMLLDHAGQHIPSSASPTGPALDPGQIRAEACSAESA